MRMLRWWPRAGPPLLQDEKAGRCQGRQEHRTGHPGPDHRGNRARPRRQAIAELVPQPSGDHRGIPPGRPVRAGHQPARPQVRPVFLHNHDRIQALTAVTGIALLIFGLIEADLRAALGDGVPLPGLLPEGRAAKPTGRAILSATYTPGGLQLDRLTPAQRMILALLGIPLPWPEKPD